MYCNLYSSCHTLRIKHTNIRHYIVLQNHGHQQAYRASALSLNKKTPSPNTDIFDYYAGAMTVSEVVYPNQTYYHWSSENTDYELRLGIYKR